MYLRRKLKRCCISTQVYLKRALSEQPDPIYGERVIAFVSLRNGRCLSRSYVSMRDTALQTTKFPRGFCLFLNCRKARPGKFIDPL